MKKSISTIPSFCFIGIILITASDRQRYSTSTFVIIAALLVLSIGSVVYNYFNITDESQKKNFNKRLIIMGITIVLSIILSVYGYLQVNP